MSLRLTVLGKLLNVAIEVCDASRRRARRSDYIWLPRDWI